MFFVFTTKFQSIFFSTIRESWIKAKYVERKFVKKLPDITNNSTSSSSSTTSQRTSRTSLMDVRKWSVRKVRRRPKSCDNSKKTNKVKTLPKTVEEPSNEPVDREKDNEVLLFGSDLDKQPVEGAIEFSSDQESTGGEEDEEPLDEEDISKLNPDLLLYKAAAAHNLPVMCEAFASGADKYWKNPEDKGRSAIHQAILSVSIKRKHTFYNVQKNLFTNSFFLPRHSFYFLYIPYVIEEF